MALALTPAPEGGAGIVRGLLRFGTGPRAVAVGLRGADCGRRVRPPAWSLVALLGLVGTVVDRSIDGKCGDGRLRFFDRTRWNSTLVHNHTAQVRDVPSEGSMVSVEIGSSQWSVSLSDRAKKSYGPAGPQAVNPRGRSIVDAAPKNAGGMACLSIGE